MTTQITDTMLGVLLQFVGQQLATGNYASMKDVWRYVDSPQAVGDVRTLFMQHGFDGDLINALSVHLMVRKLYCPSPKPLRTFAEMQQVRSQYADGLVTEGEMLLALQMTPLQVEAVIAYNRLPYKAQCKTTLADWDEEVEIRTERGDIPE